MGKVATRHRRMPESTDRAAGERMRSHTAKKTALALLPIRREEVPVDDSGEAIFADESG